MKFKSLVLLLAVTALPVQGQYFAEATRSLERADHAKLVMGDLETATTLYQQVAESASASRTDVARALVSLGHVYKMTNPDKAVDVFQRVASDYADIGSAFEEARRELSDLGVRSQVTRSDYTLIMAQMPPTNVETRRSFAFSPDGERVAVVAPVSESRKGLYPSVNREIYVISATGGARRPLLTDPKEMEWMNDPRWSPDGRFVSVTGSDAEGNHLVIANVATGEAEILSGSAFNSSRPPVWMPDSNTLIFFQGPDLAFITIDGQVSRKMPFGREIDGVFIPGMVSPNGQLLLYHSLTENADVNYEVDIWTVDLLSGQHKQRTDDAGIEAWASWNADGTAFYFSGGTQTVRNIYRQPLNGLDSRERLTAYRNAQATHPLFLAKANKLSFVLASQTSSVVLSENGQSESLVRGQYAELSADGQKVFYVDSEPGREGLWVVSPENGHSKQLAAGNLAVSYVVQRYVSSDGTKVAYARHEETETVIYVADAETGVATSIFAAEGQRDMQPVWSPDGTEIAFSTGEALYVASSDGSSVQELSTLHYWEGWSVVWSPDGTTVAALGRLNRDSPTHVFLLDPSNGTRRQLTDESLSSYKEGLNWHPSGESISFMYYGTEGDDWGGDGSMIVDVESGRFERLVDIPGSYWDYIGVWGPDGSYYFSTSPPGFGNDWMLYRHRLGQPASNAEMVQHVPGRHLSLPSFSRDGSVMVWSEQQSTNQLWVLEGFK